MKDNRQEWIRLIQTDGEEYWLREMKTAQTALIIYGVVLVAAILSRLVLPSSNQLISVGILLPWLMMSCVTFYVGYCQSKLLTFMNAKPVTHWIMISILALIGCGGIIWLAIFASSNKRAKDNLTRAIKSASTPPEQGVVSPYPRG